MRTTALLALILVSACEPGAARIEEDPDIERLQNQIDELSDELGAAQAQIDDLRNDQVAADVCIPLEEPVIAHPGNRVVLFGGACAQSVNIVTLTQSEEPYDSYDMDQVGDDLWIGFVAVGTGWYRLVSTDLDGSVECFPGPGCDEGHLDADEVTR